MRYLVNWVPRLRNKRLFVEGDIVDLSQAAPERFDKRWCTSKIMRRVRRVQYRYPYLVSLLSGLWIRIDLLRIQIQHFFLLRIRIHGFDDQKLKKNLQLEFFKNIFWIEIAIWGSFFPSWIRIWIQQLKFKRIRNHNPGYYNSIINLNGYVP